MPQKSVPFFTTLLNKLKPKLLSVLVRHVDDTFLNSIIRLPVKEDGSIDFAFMETFIAELEAERLAELEAYLKVTGLEDYALNKAEKKALEEYALLEWKEFDVLDIFEVKNTHNILSRDIIETNGTTPYLCASAENNSVDSYIDYNPAFLEKGHCIFIGGKTFTVTYQEKDFFSNDSHNGVVHQKYFRQPSQTVLSGDMLEK